MCDYSLQHIASRPAKVGDELITKNFGTGTAGFADLLNDKVAVCILPGTELAFDAPIHYGAASFFTIKSYKHSVAIFRQVNKNEPYRHHDALELPDGQIVLLTGLSPGQTATVLQLPVMDTAEKVEKARRIPIAG
jgi:hypothetical protein